MRVLLATLVGAATLAVPAAPASAVCLYPYNPVTRDCNPCGKVFGAYATVNDAVGSPGPDVYCLE